jgi:acyl-CoA synthetase (AMP-forming)/AMP-acid ligase II
VLALARHPLVDRYDVSTMRHLMSGAAPLPEPVARACVARLGCLLRQGYGLTETSPVTHAHPRRGEIRLTSVGVAVPNTEFRIVDLATRTDVAPGDTGEIWIRGPQVMKGYLHNPQATREMIDDDGWLQTGDLGYADADGYLYVVDRVKELIKYKGLQIAPAELEAVVLAHPAVADVAVIPSPDEEAGEVPVAYIVLKPGATAGSDEIREFTAGRVAPYKRLRRVEFVDAIPKVPSGNILRRQLVERERRN